MDFNVRPSDAGSQPGQRTPSPPADKPWVLVTGFEAFAGDLRNPSADLAQSLHGQDLAGHTIYSACLPVSFDDALPMLDRLLRPATTAGQTRRQPPTLVICTGLAANRLVLSFERVAINWTQARIPDNPGQQPLGTAVKKAGPAAYMSNLPVAAMAGAASAQGVLAEVSLSAGSFVCNQVFYGLMWRIHRRPALRGVRGGFVHLPWPVDLAPSGATCSSATLSDISRATRAAIACALHEGDGQLPAQAGKRILTRK